MMNAHIDRASDDDQSIPKQLIWAGVAHAENRSDCDS
jgi:hypothetical protein